ncbi:DUF2808 domain-containing protein [Kovacikia minuta CCNUW1]|uniref:DUF2808 domain-containing protein n=1 Tax=Kovacikia minuta TaxID=2931930 RepID=UPI001CCCB967|nr:DUF2808 domain-containing protein [Kovacikia minuta]UBF25749.1 DUF2808 domain-containing protein [Kovacikia minuta CCNUW1]
MFKKLVNFPFSLTPAPRLGSASILALSILLPGSLLTSTAVASQISNERSFFDHAPRLVRTAATFQDAYTPSTYQFTIKVPEDAGANLQAVRIAQDSQNIGTVDFDISQSSAFLGGSFAGGPAVSLASVGGTQPTNSNEVTIAFDPPIAPGQTVTVSLQADRNLGGGGVYLFGVTAFPTGENSPRLIPGLWTR